MYVVIDTAGKVIIGVLVVVPAIKLGRDVATGQRPDAAFMAAAVTGAVIAGYALRQVRPGAVPH
jgi:hypothetical protein